MPEEFRLAHKVLGLAAQGLDDGVDKAAGRREEQGHHSHQNNGGDEVGHVGDSLGKLLKPQVFDVVENQGQDNGEREADHQAVNRDNQRVGKQHAEVGAVEKLFKPFEPHPFAPPNAKARPVVLKGDLQAVQGEVHKHGDEHNSGDQEKVELIVPLYQLHVFFPLSLAGGQFTGGSWRIGFCFDSHRAMPPLKIGICGFFLWELFVIFTGRLCFPQEHSSRLRSSSFETG